MTVKDLIHQLSGFDPELPVCLADWAEEYLQPSELEAETIKECQGLYFSPTEDTAGRFLCLGYREENAWHKGEQP